MKKILLLLIIPLVFSFSSCLKDLDELGYYDNTVFRGVVVDCNTQQPISNVSVYAFNGEIIDSEVKTDQAGRFEINVPVEKLKNDYYLLFECDSLLQQYQVNINDAPLGTRYYDIDTIFFSGREVPYLSVRTISDITINSALCTACIDYDGNGPIIEKGFVYDTIMYPTLDNHVVSVNDGSYLFSATITINPDKYYYVRAFARNSVGVGYSDPVGFASASVLAQVVTDQVHSITANSVICGGEVVDNGGSKVLARGLCWSSSSNPTIQNSHIAVGSGLGQFSATVPMLQPNTTYQIRAYAQNEMGISYGEVRTFTTLSGMPVVHTGEIQSVSSTMAVVSSQVVDDSGFPVIHRGVCFSVSQHPTLSAPHTDDGSGIGSFSSNLTNLTPGTRYYYRAYATNGLGTEYGEEKTFVTE